MTMDELVKADRSNRRHKADPALDWHDTCEVCGRADPDGDGKNKNLVLCSHCESVVHKDCIMRWHNDLPDTKGATYTCPVCTTDIYGVDHADDCDECNEGTAILDDVQLGIDLLAAKEEAAAARAPSSSSSSTSASRPDRNAKAAEVPQSVMLAARLERCRNKRDKYVGHLVQDRNQACYKDLVLKHMGVYSFYLLADYWTKIGISKAGGTACCEGDSVGLSAHGGMFVYRNPTTAERAEISREHGVDWAQYPPPPDAEGGLAFLEEHMVAYCDDAKQDQFHTKSGIEATVACFVKARPWLGKERVSHGQSDGASNYRDPTVEVGCGVFGTRCYSVAGMGKDEGDSNGADNKAKIKSKRDAGDGVECSDTLVAMGNSAPVPGNP